MWLCHWNSSELSFHCELESQETIGYQTPLALVFHKIVSILQTSEIIGQYFVMAKLNRSLKCKLLKEDQETSNWNTAKLPCPIRRVSLCGLLRLVRTLRIYYWKELNRKNVCRKTASSVNLRPTFYNTFFFIFNLLKEILRPLEKRNFACLF